MSYPSSHAVPMSIGSTYPYCIQELANETHRTEVAEVFDIAASARFLAPAPDLWANPVEEMGKTKARRIARALYTRSDIELPIRLHGYEFGFSRIARAAIWAIENGAVSITIKERLFANLRRLLHHMSDRGNVVSRRRNIGRATASALFGDQADDLYGVEIVNIFGIRALVSIEKREILAFRVCDPYPNLG